MNMTLNTSLLIISRTTLVILGCGLHALDMQTQSFNSIYTLDPNIEFSVHLVQREGEDVQTLKWDTVGHHHVTHVTKQSGSVY